MACTLQMRQLLEAENADLKRQLAESNDRLSTIQASVCEGGGDVEKLLAIGMLGKLTTLVGNSRYRQLCDSEKQLAAARQREKLLVEKLVDARDAIESWGGYASDYFQQKHGLQQQLDGIDKFLQSLNESEAEDGD